jgi:dTDP-4-amino-4,6-dideoxygalactose transaminase
MAEKFYYEQIGDLFGSDFIMENTFWIGCHDALTKDDLDYVIETFYSFFKEKGLI